MLVYNNAKFFSNEINDYRLLKNILKSIIHFDFKNTNVPSINNESNFKEAIFIPYQRHWKKNESEKLNKLLNDSTYSKRLNIARYISKRHRNNSNSAEKLFNATRTRINIHGNIPDINYIAVDLVRGNFFSRERTQPREQYTRITVPPLRHCSFYVKFRTMSVNAELFRKALQYYNCGPRMNLDVEILRIILQIWDIYFRFSIRKSYDRILISFEIKTSFHSLLKNIYINCKIVSLKYQ